MALVQDYSLSGPFSHCRGECGRAVIAAKSLLCDFCLGLAAELEGRTDPEAALAPAETPGPVVEHVLSESEPETQPAYR